MTSTPALASVDPSQYVAAGAAKARASEAMGQVGKTIAILAQDYQDRESKRQLVESDTQLELQLGQFDNEHLGEEQYNNMDIPEDLRTQYGIQGEGVTPAYIVRADWTNKNHLEQIDKQALSIRDAQVRDAWVAQQKNSAAKDFSKGLVKKLNEQKVYALKKGMQDIQVAQKLGQYAVAERIISSLDISDMDKVTLTNQNTKMRQTDQLTSGLSPKAGESPEEQIKRYSGIAKLLQQNDVNTASQLAPSTRKMYMKEYLSLAHRVKTQQAAALAGVNKLKTYEANTTINNFNNHINVDPVKFTELMEYFITTENPTMVAKLHSAKHVYDIEDKIYSSNNPAAVYRGLMAARTHTHSPEDGKQLNLMITHAREASELLESSPIDYLEKYHVVDIEPLNIQSGYAEGLAKRFRDVSDGELQIHADLNRQLLEGTPKYKHRINQLLTTSEMRDADRFLVDAPAEDVLALSVTIQRALGDQAHLYYDQLQKFGLGGVANIASQFAIEGKTTLALNVLKGQAILRDDPKFKFDPDEQDAIEQSIGLIDTAYPTTNQRVQVRQAISAYAAFLKHEPGQDVDPSTLAQLATGGGIYIWKGRVFPNPDPQKSEKEIGTWFKKLSPKVFNNVAARQVEGVNQEQVGEYIKREFTKRNPTIKLKPTGQRGSWYFEDETGFMYRDTNGSLFKLEYSRYIQNIEDDEIFEQPANPEWTIPGVFFPTEGVE